MGLHIITLYWPPPPNRASRVGLPCGFLFAALGPFGDALGLILDFGAHVAPFGLPLAPLGSLWDPSGVPWVSLGGPRGVPWGSLGVPWGALGCPSRFSQICRKLDAQFRVNVSICTRQRIESSLPEFATGATGGRGNGSQSVAQTPLVTCAGGPRQWRTGLGMSWLDLGAHLAPFDLALGTLGASWGPFGVPGNSMDSLWGPVAFPCGSLGVPWGALGCLGVPKPIFSDLSKIGRPIPSKCVYLHAPAHRI